MYNEHLRDSGKGQVFCMYKYDGMEFSSLRELAAHAGINEKTLTARLRRGVELEEACNPVLKGRIYLRGAQKGSISDMAKRRGIDPHLIYNRRKYGYTETELFGEKRITKQGRLVAVGECEYASLAAAIRAHHLEPYEQRIRRRIGQGQSPDDVFGEFLEH